MLHYSCDSHVVEPREVFEGLEGRFGETRSPQILHNYKDNIDLIMKDGKIYKNTLE